MKRVFIHVLYVKCDCLQYTWQTSHFVLTTLAKRLLTFKQRYVESRFHDICIKYIILYEYTAFTVHRYTWIHIWIHVYSGSIFLYSNELSLSFSIRMMKKFMGDGRLECNEYLKQTEYVLEFLNSSHQVSSDYIKVLSGVCFYFLFFIYIKYLLDINHSFYLWFYVM